MAWMPATEIGPMIHERQVRIVESQVEDAKQRGARVLTGGTRLRELGPTFFAPTVLADVDQNMRVMQEETFGPVLPIAPFATMPRPCAWPTIPNTDWPPAFGRATVPAASAWLARSNAAR
jgi:acyl-CoA reductase-like NAD-dependent aldehyde dehydrogenase